MRTVQTWCWHFLDKQPICFSLLDLNQQFQNFYHFQLILYVTGHRRNLKPLFVVLLAWSQSLWLIFSSFIQHGTQFLIKIMIGIILSHQESKIKSNWFHTNVKIFVPHFVSLKLHSFLVDSLVNENDLKIVFQVVKWTTFYIMLMLTLFHDLSAILAEFANNDILSSAFFE